jgi:WD40 repeat protein
MGALPDGTPVIVSGGDDATVRVWRLVDGASTIPLIGLSGPLKGLAVHGNIIVTASMVDIAIHQLVPPQSTH